MEDPFEELDRIRAQTEKTTADFAWDYLMSPRGEPLRRKIDRYLKREYMGSLSRTTTGFWLDPLINAIDAHGGISIADAVKYVPLLTEHGDRFIDSDRSRITNEVWERIDADHDGADDAEALFHVVVGLADAVLYYQGVQFEQSLDTAFRQWVRIARRVLADYRQCRKDERPRRIEWADPDDDQQ